MEYGAPQEAGHCGGGSHARGGQKLECACVVGEMWQRAAAARFGRVAMPEAMES